MVATTKSFKEINDLALLKEELDKQQSSKSNKASKAAKSSRVSKAAKKAAEEITNMNAAKKVADDLVKPVKEAKIKKNESKAGRVATPTKQQNQPEIEAADIIASAIIGLGIYGACNLIGKGIKKIFC